MKNVVLLADWQGGKQVWLSQALQDLVKHDFWFCYWGKADFWQGVFSKNHWPQQNFKLWLWRPLWLWRLWRLKRRQQISTVLCLGAAAKLWLTSPAKRLGLSVVWLELPADLQKLAIDYQAQAAGVKLICFSSADKARLLSAGAKESALQLILPGIDAQQFYQKSLYDNLAAAQAVKRRYLTIGTVIGQEQLAELEILLQAFANCLLFDSQLQLVIIGPTVLRKTLNWVTKRMQLHHKVWLVSDEISLKKWLSSFTVFVALTKQPDLDNRIVILQAMASGLPTLASTQAGLENLSLAGRSLLLEDLDNVENLIHCLTRLLQDPILRKSLGQEAKAVAQRYFNWPRVIQELAAALNDFNQEKYVDSQKADSGPAAG